MSVLPYLLVLLAHAPLLAVYFQQLWGRPHYQFFPLVLGAAVWFLWQRWGLRQPATRRAIQVSRAILLASLLLLAYGFLRSSTLCVYISALLVVGSFLLRMGVPALGPWLLLWMLVRIPYGQDVALIQWMQRLTSKLSSTALDRLGIEHIADGNVLLFPTASLFVEEACSGVVSLLAVVACGGILAVWWRRSIVHAACLIGTAVFLAGAMNVVRVVTIALALHRLDIDLSTGWRHETLGLVIFAISLVGLFSVDRLLSFFLGPIDTNPLASYWHDAETNGFVRFWNRFVGLEQYDLDEVWHDDVPADEVPSAGLPNRAGVLGSAWDWGIAALFVVIGGGQVLAGIGPFSVAPDVSPLALAMKEESLPGQFGPWQRVDFQVEERDRSSAFGEHSRIWAFHNGHTTVRISIDFVFPEWHALQACYAGIGWQPTGFRKHQPGEETEFVEATFTRPDGQWALLMYDLFDEEGRPYEAPEGSFVHPRLRRIFRGEATRWSLPNYYQVQALTLSDVGPIDALQQDQVRELFLWFRRQMAGRIGGAAEADPSPSAAAAERPQPDRTQRGDRSATSPQFHQVPAAGRPQDSRSVSCRRRHDRGLAGNTAGIAAVHNVKELLG